MDSQYIKIFLAIAEHQSISAAAKSLHFSQPTVSEHLSHLEHTLGVQLVQREKGMRHVMLTAAGQAFLPLAQRHRELQEMLDAEIEQFIQFQSQNTFRLAASFTAHQHIMVSIIHKMMRQFVYKSYRICKQRGVLEHLQVPQSAYAGCRFRLYRNRSPKPSFSNHDPAVQRTPLDSLPRGHSTAGSDVDSGRFGSPL